jgi:hypothetical protein
MISRNSSKLIADAYHSHYTYKGTSGFRYYADSLYDFLYVNEFDAWLLNAFKMIRTTDSRGLREFIMRIHTGESLASARGIVKCCGSHLRRWRSWWADQRVSGPPSP